MAFHCPEAAEQVAAEAQVQLRALTLPVLPEEQGQEPRGHRLHEPGSAGTTSVNLS